MTGAFGNDRQLLTNLLVRELSLLEKGSQSEKPEHQCGDQNRDGENQQQPVRGLRGPTGANVWAH